MKDIKTSDMKDRELIQCILKTRNDVSEIIEALDGSGNIYDISQKIGEDKGKIISAAYELGRRYSIRTDPKIIKTPEDVYNELRHYSDRKQENLIVIALNGAHEVIFSKVVTMGLVNMTVVHPREVFSDAIRNNAIAIILSHNHPSGALTPSEEDKAITKRIVNAGQILGINVLDHLIISRGGYRSFKELGLL